MSPYLSHPEVFNQILSLSDQETRDPMLVLEQFCSDYALYELRHYLQEMVDCCVTSDSPHFSEASTRADLLCRADHFLKLFEAVMLFARRQKTS